MIEETQLTVNIPETKPYSYPIYINNKSISELKAELDRETKGRKRLIVISKKVFKLYGKELNFDKKELFILKDGEEQKNIKTFEKILKRAVSLKLSRKDVIIAIGGGVAGDMAGFAAAVYMRGVDYIQVPTTLLACVDSSVGGKTAIDLPCGKNYAGAFYQPKAVYINLNFLKTLDEKQYKSGFGEVLKYAFIEKSCKSDEYFNLLEILKSQKSEYENRDVSFLKKIIEICLKLKISVVTKDEKENGLRKILNFGHTLGHALEEETHYRRYTHGYAVVLGMMYVFNFALKNGICDRKYYDTARTLLDMYGYEIGNFWFMNKSRVLELMHNDKKADNNAITFILPSDEGEVVEYRLFDEKKPEFDINYII